MTEGGTVHKRHDGKYEVVTPVYSHQAGEPTMTDLLDELGLEAFQLDQEGRNYLEMLIQQEVIAMLTEAVRKAERDGPPPPRNVSMEEFRREFLAEACRRVLERLSWSPNSFPAR